MFELIIQQIDIMALTKRKNILRIRPKRNVSHTQPTNIASFSMNQPAVDDAKRYLAGLNEQQSGKQSQVGHGLSFDLTLAEWKSHSQLSETTPAEVMHKCRQMLLFQEQPESVPSQMKSQTNILSPTKLQKTPPKEKKIYFNFNKSALCKNKPSNQLSETVKQRKYLKQTLYTLTEQNVDCGTVKRKQIRLNFSPVNKEPDQVTTIVKSKSEWLPLHGIHMHRNKFELILNSKRQKAAKLLNIASIKPTQIINIFTRRIQ